MGFRLWNLGSNPNVYTFLFHQLGHSHKKKVSIVHTTQTSNTNCMQATKALQFNSVQASLQITIAVCHDGQAAAIAMQTMPLICTCMLGK